MTPDITITITGCKMTPEWETLQAALRQATSDDSLKFVRIARNDNRPDYRGLGVYSLLATSLNGDKKIQLEVKA